MPTQLPENERMTIGKQLRSFKNKQFGRRQRQNTAATDNHSVSPVDQYIGRSK